LSWVIGLEIAAILVSSLITLYLLHSTWNNRHAPGARTFFLLLLLNFGWLLGSTIQWNLTDPVFIFPIFKLTYLFIAFIPVVFLIFALQLTSQDLLRSQHLALFLSIVPITTQFFVWTNEYHNLMWSSFELTHHGIFTSVISDFGLWFWIHAAYSYSLIVIALLILARSVLTAEGITRKQSLLIITGMSLPLLLNLAFVLKLLPALNLDITPICFAFINPAVAYGLLRLRTFELIPISRSDLIDGISDGIMVVDHLDRIIDLNPAACMIFGLEAKTSVGRNIHELAPVLEPWLEYDELKTWQQPQIQFTINGTTRYYSLRMSSLMNHAGHMLGRMFILRNVTRLKESELAERQARQLAEKRSSELEVLSQFAGTLNHASTLHEVTTSAFQVLLSHVKAEAAWLVLTRNLTPPGLAAVQTRNGLLDPAAFDSSKCFSCPLAEQLLNSNARMAEVTTCHILEQIWPDPAAPVNQLCIPLQIGERVLGAVHLVFTEPIQQELTRSSFYLTIAKQFSAAIERTCLFEDVQQLAIKDPLTNLFNRRHFSYLAQRELRRAARFSRPLAVIMMDLDHFKKINDLYGHMTGDRILREISQRCLQGMRQLDMLARFGGEEFIFLLPECEFEQAVQVAERLRQEISGTPFSTPHDLIWVTASFGVSSLVPDETTIIEELIEEADTSLYNAKATGRNNVKA